MNYKLNIFILLFSLGILVSCKDNQGYKKIENKAPEMDKTVHEIVVNDFIDASPYTYIQVTEAGHSYWMAIPKTPVAIGDVYYYAGGMPMKDFVSEQLNKTFDEIIFVERISASKDIVNAPIKNPHATGEIPIPDGIELNIPQPEGGITVKEIFTQKAALKDKEVLIKGKVVKVNNGILDKNWVHIADGTTFENKKDITVTTTAMIQVGDTVTFKAKVVLDKDFGGGYVYGLLLEDGQVVQE